MLVYILVLDIKTEGSHYIREAHAALDGAVVVIGSDEAGGNDAIRRENFPHAIGGVRVVVAQFPRLLARVVADDYKAERPFGLARGPGGWMKPEHFVAIRRSRSSQKNTRYLRYHAS